MVKSFRFDNVKLPMIKKIKGKYTALSEKGDRSFGAYKTLAEGEVKEFDKPALLQIFDQIRRTLSLSN